MIDNKPIRAGYQDTSVGKVMLGMDDSRNSGPATPRIYRVDAALLTEARWSEEEQQETAPRLGHPDAVWVFDGSDFPKQGRKSAGVGGSTAAGWARWPTARPGCSWRMSVPWAGHWWTSGCTCRRVGPRTRSGVRRRGCRRRAQLPLKDRTGLGDAGAGPESGSSQGRVGCRMTTRDVAVFPGGSAALEMRRAGRSGQTPVRMEPAWTRNIRGPGAPANPGCRKVSAEAWSRRDELDEAWRETVAREEGPRSYQFSAQRVRATRKGKPGEELWAVPPEPGRGTWTAVSPATTCPTLPKTRLWRLWHTWAVPGGALKRSSRRRRATWGWTNTRPGVGRVGSIPAMCLLGAAFLLGAGGKRCRRTRPQVYRVVREAAPGAVRAGGVAALA